MTHYVWDELEDAIIAEYDDNGNVTAHYTNEANGRPLSMERSGQRYYFHYDGSGNVTEITDDTGNVVARYRYHAFGKVTESLGTVENPYQYGGAMGYYTDSETGLVYVRARMYDETSGRWLSTDPIGIDGGLNLYNFVNQNPLLFVDPSGMIAIATTCGGEDDKPKPNTPTCLDRFPAPKGVPNKSLKEWLEILEKCKKDPKPLVCIEKAVSPGKPIQKGLIEWMALLRCCDNVSDQLHADPCECGTPGGNPGAKQRDCIDPLKAPETLGTYCQDCCEFMGCVVAYKTLIEVAGGNLGRPIIQSIVKNGFNTKKCLLACAVK